MTAILVVASLTLFTSFLCSILEAALFAVTPTQLEVMQKAGVRGARRFARFKADVEEPIAAILTVNTLSHTAGATLCGWLVADYFGSAALGWFTALFTLMVLFVSEIVPKSLGVRFAPQLVPFVALPMQLIVWVSLPIAKICKHLMQRLTGQGDAHLPTTEEIIAMSRIAVREGELSAREMRWVENSLQLSTVTAKDVMTPRTVVQTVPTDALLRDLVAEPQNLRHSRLPVTEGERQDLPVGFVYRRDVFDAVAEGRGAATVRELMRPLEFVPEGMGGQKLLEKLVRGKRHLVAVIDEYGGFEGIVTLEDVLEALIGTEIVDEHDEHVDMQEFARLQALARAQDAASEAGAASTSDPLGGGAPVDRG